MSNAVLLETAVTVSVWISLAAPELTPSKGTSVFAKFTTNETLVMGLSVGGSFTALTVRRNAVLRLLAPSLTVRVINEVPNRFAAGTTVTVRFVPLPSKNMLFVATSAAFVDVALNASRKAGVSGSVTVNGSVMGLSSLIV